MLVRKKKPKKRHFNTNRWRDGVDATIHTHIVYKRAFESFDGKNIYGEFCVEELRLMIICCDTIFIYTIKDKMTFSFPFFPIIAVIVIRSCIFFFFCTFYVFQASVNVFKLFKSNSSIKSLMLNITIVCTYAHTHVLYRYKFKNL